MIHVIPVTTDAQLNDFLRVQAAVRPKEMCTQSSDTIRRLIEGSHPLSADLKVSAFMTEDEGKLLGRIATTLDSKIPGHTLVGFFECVDDQPVADALFAAAASAGGPPDLLGPVDASFWVGYRLRTAGFDQPPFYGEPVNPEWYPRLFERAGFTVAQRYVSRRYRPDERIDLSLFADLRVGYEAKGYEFHVPTRTSFEDDLREIHGLISQLYADFPVYSPIDWPAFRAMFGGLKTITDLNLVTIARFHGEPVGFQITLPDYGNRLDRGPLPMRLAHLARVRHLGGAKAYISLYSGAKREHRGLGKALLMDFVRACVEHGADGIGALVAEGKVTGSYLPEYVVGTSEHCLYERTAAASRATTSTAHATAIDGSQSQT